MAEQLPKFDPNIDYFGVLGLKPGASHKEIKKAFRDKSKLYHPDISKLENAEEMFKQCNEAYHVLTTEEIAFEYKKVWEAKIIQQEKLKKLSQQQRKLREKLERKEQQSNEVKKDNTRLEKCEMIKKSGGYDILYNIQRKFEEDQKKKLVEDKKITKFTRRVKVKWKTREFSKRDIQMIFQKKFGAVERVKKKKHKKIAFVTFGNSNAAVEACLKGLSHENERFVVKPSKERKKR